MAFLVTAIFSISAISLAADDFKAWENAYDKDGGAIFRSLCGMAERGMAIM